MASYLHLYCAYTHTYTEDEKRRVWGIWYHEDVLWLGVLSGCMGAIGFLYLSIFLIFVVDGHSVPAQSAWLVIWPYALFLVFSALYTPLLAAVRSGLVGAWAVIADLLVVAAATVLLSAWTLNHWSWAEAPFLNLGVLWLAVHCTILDFGLWGYTWFNGWMWDNEEEDIERAWPLPVLLLSSGSTHKQYGDGIGKADEDPRLMVGYVG